MVCYQRFYSSSSDHDTVLLFSFNASFLTWTLIFNWFSFHALTCSERTRNFTESSSLRHKNLNSLSFPVLVSSLSLLSLWLASCVSFSFPLKTVLKFFPKLFWIVRITNNHKVKHLISKETSLSRFCSCALFLFVTLLSSHLVVLAPICRIFVLGIGFFSLCFLMTSLGGQFSAKRPGDSPFTVRAEGRTLPVSCRCCSVSSRSRVMNRLWACWEIRGVPLIAASGLSDLLTLLIRSVSGGRRSSLLSSTPLSF